LTAVLIATEQITPWEKIAVARLTRPLRGLWRRLKSGIGGSSAFMGLLDEWEMPWKPGRVILGASLYEPGQRLGKWDDRHIITIATNRAARGGRASSRIC
jgi:hypothetical protein